ncbi:MAG: DinB family protein [Acidobacteriota bacterium]|nr:DinB family protein [Acidobacteriota bacterium]
MMNLTINKPSENEYARYYDGYVSLVPEGDILTILDEQLNETLSLIRSIPEPAGSFRYAPDKWSIKELIGHIIDTERVFAYRALCIARGDQRPLLGFDEKEYMLYAPFEHCSLEDLSAEFEAVRKSTLFLFKQLDQNAWHRIGTASENKVTVRALAYIIAGHERHHCNILRDRYLQSEQFTSAAV